MIKLKPVRDKAEFHRTVYREIKALLERILFVPVMAIAENSILDNSLGELLTALRKGEIGYADGYFTGKFNAHIGFELRQIGASWDKGKKAYFLQESKVPSEIKIAIARGRADTQDKIDRIKQRLDSLQKDGAVPSIDFERQVAGITLDLDQQVRAVVPKDIGLPMTQTAEMKEALRAGYTESVNLYIQKMARESAQRLREKIVERVEQGGRAADLVPLILSQKGVSDRHAMFIAKQETSILVSTYRDARYREAGIGEYVWSTSHDSRVRHSHKVLDGRKFKFSEPPVTDPATGARNNPGYDYGCRCVAIPLLEEDTPSRILQGVRRRKEMRLLWQDLWR